MSIQLASCCCNTAGHSKMYSGTVNPSNSIGPTFQFVVQGARGGSSQPRGMNASHQMQPARGLTHGQARILPKSILADLITALLERRSFEELLKTLHELQSNRAYGIGSRDSSSAGSVLRVNGSHCSVGSNTVGSTIEGRNVSNEPFAAHAHPTTPNHPSHPGHTEESNSEAVPGLEHGQEH